VLSISLCSVSHSSHHKDLCHKVSIKVTLSFLGPSVDLREVSYLAIEEGSPLWILEIEIQGLLQLVAEKVDGKTSLKMVP
jgi:hypothetical protein